MLKQLKELYLLLDADQRKKLLQLQVLVILMAFAEMASVVAVGPFMSLVADPAVLESDGVLAKAYALSGLTEPSDFMFWLGIGVLLMLALAAGVSILTIWRLSVYGVQVGAQISTRLYRHYMYQSWLFHAGGSSSQLVNKIAQEATRLNNGVINPFMQLNSRLNLVLLMSLALVIYNPLVAVIGVSVFSCSYLLIFKLIRSRIVRNGRTVTKAQKQRFKMMGEGLGGIKDVILLGRQQTFVSRFANASKQMADAQGKNRVMAQTPRYIMELVAFSTIIFLILYLLSSNDGNIAAVLPILSVYALAGMKLLPAFQQVYASFSQIRGSLAAFDEIREDLINSKNDTGMRCRGTSGKQRLDPTGEQQSKTLKAKKTIEFNNVTFTYPGKPSPALNGMNLTIPVNKVIGLVGASGSGKSTAIDMLLGLILPDSGEVLIDGKPLANDDKRAWQNSIGFVPQSIFLSDSSIAENIAFGIPKENINKEKVKKAASMAHLDELLDELPEGLQTRVGERGVQLSGGQRQRIGIARALYDDADILVMDEATSALDGITEKYIMDAIHDLSGKKTIVMIAHRLSTVKSCESIYIIGEGKVVDEGGYEDLIERNAEFKKMAGLNF
ncbi:ABC transporter ATP-binding protein [Alcanivorax sp. NBRC 102024]|uniref:ABC transporter ATP-binding protein n=1 Tax=Alcanivorax sp. NBRC 102024 TaxID=1113895 RepID=UPI000789E0FE|nr:ABC transporter ATP-binding protein [Alcanivorax sp. NBRC 102024]